MTSPRAYLDWNATAPLRPEAKAAMAGAWEVAGNPSSVHAEGRAARGVIERARAQVAALMGCDAGEVIFTSGATEAAALALHDAGPVAALATEHDCVSMWASRELPVDARGLAEPPLHGCTLTGALAWQGANSETGVIQDPPPETPSAQVVADMVQCAGKVPLPFQAPMMLVSAHKLGGPKGVGALILRDGLEVAPLARGGGQELRRRPGTENVVGIAGFGAAAEAALRDLERGEWERVAKLRDALEARLEDGAPDIIFMGRGASRLPNTTCFAAPGWKGETQVMQMDLAGFAVSAGSACASGKTEPSRVLRAMGHDETTAASALRVSIGPETTEQEVMGFAEVWTERHRRFRRKSA